MTMQTADRVNPQFNLSVSLAADKTEVEQAMRLRYQVFVEEEKNLRMRNENRLEFDAYDDWCDHLIVKDLDTGLVVGTYRLLPGERALQRGTSGGWPPS